MKIDGSGPERLKKYKSSQLHPNEASPMKEHELGPANWPQMTGPRVHNSRTYVPPVTQFKCQDRAARRKNHTPADIRHIPHVQEGETASVLLPGVVHVRPVRKAEMMGHGRQEHFVTNQKVLKKEEEKCFELAEMSSIRLHGRESHLDSLRNVFGVFWLEPAGNEARKDQNSDDDSLTARVDDKKKTKNAPNELLPDFFKWLK